MSSVIARWRRQSPRRRALAAASVALILASGCGGTADDSAGSTTTAEASASAGTLADIDPCTLVTQAEAGKALGGSVGEPERPKEANLPPRLVTCRYVAERGLGVAVMSVMVRQGERESESRIGFEQAMKQFPEAQAVEGIGQNAFWYGNQINVLQGRIYLNITGDFDLATARALASTALQRL
jgi:hypothetical protein